MSGPALQVQVLTSVTINQHDVYSQSALMRPLLLAITMVLRLVLKLSLSVVSISLYKSKKGYLLTFRFRQLL